MEDRRDGASKSIRGIGEVNSVSAINAVHFRQDPTTNTVTKDISVDQIGDYLDNTDFSITNEKSVHEQIVITNSTQVYTIDSQQELIKNIHEYVNHLCERGAYLCKKLEIPNTTRTLCGSC